jgi:predicted MFS family arabinose efflux permease
LSDRAIKFPAIILLLAFVILLFNSGMRFSLGLLLLPMADSLQWSRTALSSMATVFMLVAAAALPFTGQLVDRIGPFRVLTGGVLLAGLSLVLTSQIEHPWQAYLCYGVLFALGSAATSITPIGVILSRAFPERTGLANSVAISGMGLGQLLIVSVLAASLWQLGWRGAFMWLGIGSVLLIAPLLFLTMRVARQQSVKDSAAVQKTATQTKPGLATAMRSKPLWLVLLIYAICGFQDFFIATHIVALASESNVDRATAGQLLALMGLAGLCGVLPAGALADRFGVKRVTLFCFILRCVLFALMLVSREPYAVITAALMFGFTFWMTAPLTVIFARQIVGVSLLGTVSGVITMVHHGMGGFGALFGALGFDQSGSYDSGLLAMLVLSVVGGALTLMYRDKHDEPARTF